LQFDHSAHELPVAADTRLRRQSAKAAELAKISIYNP